MTRGALYMVWPGTERTEAMLSRSVASLARFHPELPHEVVRLPDNRNLLSKSEMGRRSPFEETLFLDADTVVLGRLDYAFDKAARFGLACCICECPFARRYGGLAGRGDMLEYNTGVLFWTAKAAHVMDRWMRLSPDIDSSIVFKNGDGLARMAVNDQAAFAEAIEQTGFNPWVLPQNWNLRPKWQRTVFGPVKVWHDYSDVPASVADWSAAQARPDAVLECAGLP